MSDEGIWVIFRTLTEMWTGMRHAERVLNSVPVRQYYKTRGRPSFKNKYTSCGEKASFGEEVVCKGGQFRGSWILFNK